MFDYETISHRRKMILHHGGTETLRKNKIKARPEGTEMAEVTERSAGATGVGTGIRSRSR